MKIVKVVIIKSSSPDYWYANRAGERYSVEANNIYDGKLQVVGKNLLIDVSDCEEMNEYKIEYTLSSTKINGEKCFDGETVEGSITVQSKDKIEDVINSAVRTILNSLILNGVGKIVVNLIKVTEIV